MNKKKSYITFLNIFILLAVLFVANNAESAENNDKLENYYKEMRSFLMSYWSLSAGYKKEPGGLSATLKITINERGKVLSYELINKSGDKVFDDACISTVEKIKKFPKPPTDIWLFTLKEGLILKFKPSSVQFNFGRPSKFCHTMNEKIDNEGYKELSSNLIDKNYIQRLRAVLAKKSDLYGGDHRMIYKARTGEEDKLTTTFGFDIDSEGSVESVTVICPSTIHVFDELILKKYSKIDNFPAPPAEILDANKHFKFIWTYVLYINNN